MTPELDIEKGNISKSKNKESASDGQIRSRHIRSHVLILIILLLMLAFSGIAKADSVWVTSGPSGWYNRSYANFTWDSNDSGDIYLISLNSYSNFLSDKYYNATGLTEKNYTFSVKAYNGSAWVGPTSRAFMVDLTPPNINITSGPGSWLNSSTASFAWTGSDSRSGIAGYYFWLDGGAQTYTTGTNVTLTNISSGNHVFYVEAVDNVGWTATATYNFGINTDLPVVTITSGPQNNGWTNTSTPTFTYVGMAYNSTILGYYYRWDSIPQNTTASTRITLPVLSDGAHVFYIQAVDAKGHIGNVVSVNFSIDTVPPMATIVSGPSGWSNISTFSFMWSGSDDRSGISGYYYQLDNSIAVFTANNTVTLSAADGWHTFSLKPVDNAGNFGTSINRSFGIDTSTPTLSITYGPTGWIGWNYAEFGWNAYSASGISSYYYWLDNGSKTSTLNTSTVIHSISDGAHTFYVQAFNGLNVGSSVQSWSFSVDTTPPPAPAVTESKCNGSTTPDPPWSSHNTPYFTWPDVIDTGSGINHYEVSVNNGSWAPVTSPYSPTMQTGSYAFSFRAVDNAGNAGSSTVIYVRIDITPPIAWFTNALQYFNISIVNFTWNGSDNESGLAGYYYSIDNGSQIYTTSSSVTANVPQGIHVIYLEPIDNVGNIGTEINQSFIVDLVPPTVNITSGQSGWLGSSTQTFTWVGSSDLSGIRGYYYKVDNGSWMYTQLTSTIVYLIDGPHAFYVEAVDNAGNVGNYDSVSFAIDTTPPPAPIVTENQSNGSTTPNPPWTSHNMPYFTWDTSNDSKYMISYYQVSLDGNSSWINVTTPYNPTISDGNHTFDFRAVNILGLASNITRLYVRIDTIPPSIVITRGPSGWIYTTTPTLSWMGVDNESGISGYYYNIDNGALIFTTSTSINLPPFLDGFHTFSVQAVDNVSLRSPNATANFAIDTIPPSVPVVTESNCNGSTTPNPPWSGNNNPYFNWTDSIDTESGINHYEARVNNGSYNGSWITVTRPWQPIFSGGSYAVDFRAVDNAGNPGNFTTIYVRIDNVPPFMSNISIPNGWINTTSFTVTWNGTDNDSGIAGYYYSLDSTPLTFTKNTSAVITALDGIHTLSVQAEDNVGLLSVPMNATLKIDTAPPTVTITSGPTGWTNISSATFAWNGSDTESGIKGYYYSVDSASWTYTPYNSVAYMTLSDGNHTFYVKAVDNAGNIGNPDSRSFMVDNVPPYLNITSYPDVWTNSSTPYFAWYGSDNESGLGGYYYSVDGGNSTFTTATNVTLPPLAEGMHTFVLTAVDNAGLTTTAQKTFGIDTSPPTVNITSSPPAMTNNKTAAFTWSGVDEYSGLRGYYYSFDNSSEIFTLGTNITFTSLPDGTHTFKVRAVDMVWLFSNYDSRTFVLNTAPPTTPVVTESNCNGSPLPNPPWCTQNAPYFTWPNSTGFPGAAIYYQASINNGSWQQVNSPYSPAMQTGTYTFQFRAVDSFGNPSGFCTIYVRIDITPPVVNMTSYLTGWTDQPVLAFGWNGTDEGSGIAGYYYRVDNGSWISTTAASASINNNASLFADGAHTFSVYAVDNVGWNSAVVSVLFYVDNNPPTVTIVQHPNYYTNDSTPYFAWTGSDGTGSGIAGYRYWVDGSSPVSTTSTDATLPSLPDGNHTFNIVAIDNVGLVSPAVNYSFIVDAAGPGLMNVTESNCNGSTTPNPPWSVHNNPYFTWSAPSSPIPIDHYEVGTDNVTWTTVTSPYNPTMGTGSYAFEFRAVDAAGTQGKITTVYVRIDITPPVMNSVTGPSGWISTNPSALNPYTSQIAWIASDGGSGVAGYYYNFDGKPDNFTTSSSIALPPLPDGAHTFSVKAVDGVGWQSNYSSISFSLDTVPPSVPVVSELAANGSTMPNPPWSINGIVDFVWNASIDMESGVAYYQMRENNGAWQKLTSPYISNLTTGNYTFDFRAVDNASNPSDKTRLYVRMDMDDPTIQIPQTSSFTTSGNITFITNPADVGSGVNNVYMQIEDAINGTIVFSDWIGSSGIYTLTNVTPGAYYAARAFDVDNAGRKSNWTPWGNPGMYDIWLPVANQPNMTSPTYGGGRGFTFVNATQSSIVFNFSATDVPGSGIDHISYEIYRVSVSDLLSGPNRTLAYSGNISNPGPFDFWTSSGYNFSTSFAVSSPQSATAYIARISAYARSGQFSGWSNFTTVIYDNEFPNLTVVNASRYIKGNTAIISGYASDDTPLPGNPYVWAEVNNNGSIASLPAIPGSNNSFTVQINNVTEGISVKLIAQDFAGNRIEKMIDMYKDTTPPIITITDLPEGYRTNAQNYTIKGTVFDDYEMDSLTVDSLNASLSGTNWFRPAILNWNSTVQLYEGKNTFSIAAKDAAGNVANTSIDIYAYYSPPQLEILNPEDSAIIQVDSTTISGVAWDNDNISAVYVNGNLATGTFGSPWVAWYYDTPLDNGTNTFIVTAVDDANNSISKRITLIRQTTAPSITITNLANGDHVGTQNLSINGTAYSPDGIAKITVDLMSFVPGGASSPYASYVLYPSNTTCAPSGSISNSSIIDSILGWLFPPSGSTCIASNSTNWTGSIVWSQNAKIVPGMYIIDARVYSVAGLTGSTDLYIKYDDVPVITIANPTRRVTRTSDLGIVASGTAQTNNTNITSISVRVYNSDGVIVNDAALSAENSTFVTWSSPIALYRYGTFAVEVRAYIADGDYSKKEFLINRIPDNFTAEYFYPATQGRYPMLNFTSNNTVDYYNFYKMSTDNGTTQNYLLHYYLDWGEGWWKVKDNQTISAGVQDNSGMVAGLPNYSWPVKQLLQYNLTWVAHVRWDYQEKPPQDIGENMVGWFKDLPPPGYPPYPNINTLIDPNDMGLPWFAGNLTQHGWVRVDPNIWDWNRYYGKPFTYPLKLDWTLDGMPIPPQVYMGQRASHDEGDDVPQPQGIFWMPTTGMHTIGLTVTDSGMGSIDDVPGDIVYNPKQGYSSQVVSVYNDPPVISGMLASGSLNLTNAYSATALQYLSLAGETPSSNPLGEALAPWAGQHNPIHIGDPANITINATDPEIEDMQYQDYMHYRYIWGDGYESGWISSVPLNQTFITSTELVWNQTTLIPRTNPQANNLTHRYAAWKGTDNFILNKSVNFEAQAEDPYNAIGSYNDSVFVYDNPPRAPIITAIRNIRSVPFLPSDAYLERIPVIFNSISYDPDNPHGDPKGDQIWYMYDFGDGNQSVWSTTGNTSYAYIPDHWDYQDDQGRYYDIFYVTVTVKDNWGLMISSTKAIKIYKHRPPQITINSVDFEGINLDYASPRFYCGYDCNSQTRFHYSINPSTINVMLVNPDDRSDHNFDVIYDWGMNGVETSTNQYRFGYAIYRPDDEDPPTWILGYNLGWNLDWSQYAAGTYTVTVTATDDWGATSTKSADATAYYPINAVGSGIFYPDFSDYSMYDFSGFYSEMFSCSISCYYLNGYAIDHYVAATSATVSGPFGGIYTNDTSIDPYYNVDITDYMGGVHHGTIKGTNGDNIRSYIAGMLGIPVS